MSKKPSINRRQKRVAHRVSGQWQLMHAKAQFSQLVELAEQGEPQIVTKRGRAAVVVVSSERYKTLQGQPRTAFDAFKNAPKLDDFNPERLRGRPRELNLE